MVEEKSLPLLSNKGLEIVCTTIVMIVDTKVSDTELRLYLTRNFIINIIKIKVITNHILNHF